MPIWCSIRVLLKKNVKFYSSIKEKNKTSLDWSFFLICKLIQFEACAGLDTEMSFKRLDMHMSFIYWHTNLFEQRKSAQSVER